MANHKLTPSELQALHVQIAKLNFIKKTVKELRDLVNTKEPKIYANTLTAIEYIKELQEPLNDLLNEQ